MSQEILELNEAERKWIDAHLQLALTAIQTFAPEHGDQITPAALDAAFAAWLSQHDPQQEDPNTLINGFGIGFGQYLADHLDFEWVLVRDNNSTEIAVQGQPGDMLIFPPNLIAKRYTIRDTGFFAPLYAQMEQEIAAMRRDASAKSRWKFWRKDGQ
jgi:hypothetical protein